MRHILHRRAAVKALHGANPTIVIDTGNPRLFAFLRKAPAGPLLCLFNFSEEWTSIDSGLAAHHGVTRFHDLLSDADLQLHDGAIALPPYARALAGLRGALRRPVAGRRLALIGVDLCGMVG